MNDIRENLKTCNENTWCPGCQNFGILESVKRVIAKLISEGYKQEDFAMVAGIGCHAKIFDYLNLSGIYGLHGRVLPTALGIKIGNPNLNVFGFAGDGDTYAEGMEHFIHAFRHNPKMVFIVHDNGTFSLTSGQSTPTSQKGYKNKSQPLGVFNEPLIPTKLALAAGATFIARCNALDIKHSQEILEKAMNHNGFAFIEVIENCIIFNLEKPNLSKSMYKIEDNHDIDVARKLIDEWDYSNNSGKLPLGVLYQKESVSFEDKWPQLAELKNNKIGWVDLKK